jgi:hypothetical protein
MKKLLLAVSVTLCAAPAFAAGSAHHLLAATTVSHTSSVKSTLPTLPPMSGSLQITAAGFGAASSPSLKPITLPGLGTISATYDNTGKGGTMTLDVSFVTASASSSSVTAVTPVSTPSSSGSSSSTTVPLNVQFNLTSAGSGLPSSGSQTSTLSHGGQMTTTYSNAGSSGNDTLQIQYINSSF